MSSNSVSLIKDSDEQRTSDNHVVRQRRIEVFGDDSFLKVNGKKYEVYDCTPFGIAVVTTDDFKEQDFFDAELSYHGIVINKLHIRKVRRDGLKGNESKFAFEIIGEPIEIEKIKAIKVSQRVLKEHNEDYQNYLSIPELFRKGVYEMKDWLESLRTRVNSLSSSYDLTKIDEISNYEGTIAELVGEFIVKSVEPQYLILEKSLDGLSQQQRAGAFEFFRKKMKEMLMEGPFPNRSFSKPLGYAGDYQMMNQIYHREPLGDSLFAKSLHLYFVLTPESRAVRNRARYLQEKIKQYLKMKKSDEKINILSVACGPAMEIQYLIKENPELLKNVNFHLLDQEGESLEHAQRQIRNLAREHDTKVNCTFVHKSVKNIIGGGLRGNQYDFIYSAGLFDYFSDPVAQIAGQRLMELLAKNGRLIIGNFNISSPNKFGMSIALDWQLIYRSKDDLFRLFSHLGGTLDIEQEPEGVNLFCNLSKV